MQDIPTVNKSLLELEEELGRFKSAKEALQSAYGEARSILKKWEKIRGEQDEAIRQVYKDTVNNARATAQLIDNMHALYESLNRLAVTVEKVDYPARLDKLDANVSTVTLTMQGLQNRIDLYERNVSGKVEALGNEIESSKSSIMREMRGLESRIDAFENEISKILHSMRSDIVSTTRSSKDTITAMLRGEAESTRQFLFEEVHKARKNNQIWLILIMLSVLGCIAVVTYGLLMK